MAVALLASLLVGLAFGIVDEAAPSDVEEGPPTTSSRNSVSGRPVFWNWYRDPPGGYLPTSQTCDDADFSRSGRLPSEAGPGDARWAPAHFFSPRNNHYLIMGLRRQGEGGPPYSEPRSDVLWSGDGGATWYCIPTSAAGPHGMTGAVSFLVQQPLPPSLASSPCARANARDKEGRPLSNYTTHICFAGGRPLVPAPDGRDVRVWGPALPNVSCVALETSVSIDGATGRAYGDLSLPPLLDWFPAASLPCPATGLTHFTHTIGGYTRGSNSSHRHVLIGGWRGDGSAGLLEAVFGRQPANSPFLVDALIIQSWREHSTRDTSANAKRPLQRSGGLAAFVPSIDRLVYAGGVYDATAGGPGALTPGGFGEVGDVDAGTGTSLQDLSLVDMLVLNVSGPLLADQPLELDLPRVRVELPEPRPRRPEFGYSLAALPGLGGLNSTGHGNATLFFQAGPNSYEVTLQLGPGAGSFRVTETARHLHLVYSFQPRIPGPYPPLEGEPDTLPNTPFPGLLLPLLTEPLEGADLLPPPGWQTGPVDPSYFAPASNTTNNRVNIPWFPHVLGVDMSGSGPSRLVRGSKTMCGGLLYDTFECPFGEYPEQCTHSPFDTPCVPCVTCVAPPDAPTCTRTDHFLCPACKPCPTGQVELYPCGHPLSPGPDTPACLTLGAQSSSPSPSPSPGAGSWAHAPVMSGEQRALAGGLLGAHAVAVLVGLAAGAGLAQGVSSQWGGGQAKTAGNGVCAVPQDEESSESGASRHSTGRNSVTLLSPIQAAVRAASERTLGRERSVVHEEDWVGGRINGVGKNSGGFPGSSNRGASVVRNDDGTEWPLKLWVVGLQRSFGHMFTRTGRKANLGGGRQRNPLRRTTPPVNIAYAWLVAQLPAMACAWRMWCGGAAVLLACVIGGGALFSGRASYAGQVMLALVIARPLLLLPLTMAGTAFAAARGESSLHLLIEQGVATVSGSNNPPSGSAMHAAPSLSMARSLHVTYVVASWILAPRLLWARAVAALQETQRDAVAENRKASPLLCMRSIRVGCLASAGLIDAPLVALSAVFAMWAYSDGELELEAARRSASSPFAADAAMTLVWTCLMALLWTLQTADNALLWLVPLPAQCGVLEAGTGSRVVRPQPSQQGASWAALGVPGAAVGPIPHSEHEVGGLLPAAEQPLFLGSPAQPRPLPVPEPEDAVTLISELWARARTPEGRRLAGMRIFFRTHAFLLSSAVSAVQQVPLPPKWVSLLQQLEVEPTGDGVDISHVLGTEALASVPAVQQRSGQSGDDSDHESTSSYLSVAGDEDEKECEEEEDVGGTDEEEDSY